ncbi:LEA domain protein [Aspergillus pseudotamarii]|uniref:LEA domain protein n=1 Tax=Aspergillus pseudotamarii TaxID=132259 RepID=A0A5N6SJ92_ASPPS|nr:LEA domain protein [Aspergillus pseudotamarii]KAE8133820.1 LEA domain protein [Aspergillus pseudotamarii]
MDQVKIPLKPFPVAQVHEIEFGVYLLPPLSRRGIGPALIIIVPDGPPNKQVLTNGVPTPSLKWAEEGYTVLEVRGPALTRGYTLNQAIETLAQHGQCSGHGTIGLVAYDFQLWERVHSLPEIKKITAAVIYGAASDASGLSSSTIPTVQHLSGKASMPLQRTEFLMQYEYPKMSSQWFALPTAPGFDYATEAISHTRNLTFLKRQMNGPYFDLEAIWEEHTYFEFDNRSVEHTMNTMVQEPYVNHIPTMTGGIGRHNLTRFYRDNFIFSNPPDTQNELISRTIGIDRVVDEFIMTFTHNSEVDWLIPGIPPTGCQLEIPFMAVVNIRGDRLYHEHITWDQATVLKQLGLMPEYVPYPYPLPDGQRPAEGKSFAVRVPAAGAETAAKMRDKNAVPSNQLMAGGIQEV